MERKMSFVMGEKIDENKPARRTEGKRKEGEGGGEMKTQERM